MTVSPITVIKLGGSTLGRHDTGLGSLTPFPSPSLRERGDRQSLP